MRYITHHKSNKNDVEKTFLEFDHFEITKILIAEARARGFDVPDSAIPESRDMTLTRLSHGESFGMGCRNAMLYWEPKK